MKRKYVSSAQILEHTIQVELICACDFPLMTFSSYSSQGTKRRNRETELSSTQSRIPETMEELIRQVEELRHDALGPYSRVADSCRFQLLDCLDRFFLPPDLSSSVIPSAYLQLCWGLRGKFSAQELLCLSEKTMSRLTARVLSSTRDIDAACTHWKLLKSERQRLLELEAEVQRRQLEQLKEKQHRAKSTPQRSWTTFLNPEPWRRI